ncbi:MAG: osmoprotectant transport system substrate-binding protein [Solirubrobacteraceae bacterium]|nr:osmoprotectant transport system substrate-binding protein [Solirubrobacteraceae bacterium]
MRPVLAVVALVLTLAGCGGGSEARPVAPSDGDRAPLRIGTKDFTEQYILGELYAQALEAKGIPVELKPDVGSSEITHQALAGGALDMYPEYVGVLLSEVANDRSRPRNARDAYRIAKAFEERNGFTLLGMTPFSDANALAVTPAYARRHSLRDISDLRGVPGTVRIGAPPEFRTRFEGLVGLGQRYGLENARAVPMAIGAQYAALDSGKVDAAAVFTTAGQLADRRLVLLDDPRGVFGTQHVAPVISRRALKAFGPRLSAILDSVSARLTATAMRRMNAAVDLRGREPGEIADEFLRGQRLK